MRKIPGYHSMLSSRRLLQVITIAIVMYICSPCNAQRYQVDTYTEDDGLPSSNIKDITQDKSGRMWFATRSGIAVYDGLDWKTYHLADGLASTSYNYILEDRAGRMWAITNARGTIISCFNGTRWNRIPKIPVTLRVRGNISSAATVASGDTSILLIGHRWGGLLYWNGTNWKKPHPQKILDNTAIRWIEKAGDEVYVASDTGLWFASTKEAPDSFRLCQSVPKDDILTLSFDPSRRIMWMVTKDWIGKLRDGKFTRLSCYPTTNILENYSTLTCEHLPGEGLFFGNENILYHLDSRSNLKPILIKNGLIANGITSLYLDREGNMWTGGFRGVSKIVNIRFANYQKDHGLLEDEVSAITELQSGEIVLGHPSGISIMDDTIRTIRFTDNKMGVRVLDMAQDTMGNLWLAVYGMGLARIDTSWNIKWYYPEKDPQARLTSVIATKQGDIWVTSNSSVYLKKNNRFEKIETPLIKKTSGLPGIRKIFEGSNGSIYIATQRAGLCSIRRGQTSFSFIKIGNTSNENSVFAFYEREGGEKWVGTVAGLFRANGKEFSRPAMDGPRIYRPVYFIMEDNKKRMWFGTDNGVSRWNGKELLHFTLENGLIGRETNRAAGIQDSRGRVWIGMDSGVSIYRENLDWDHSVKPVIKLLSLDNSSGESLPLGEKISLPYEENNIKFRFRAISFVNEKMLRFRTWLEGYESDWQGPYSCPDQQIRYTNLPPGEYVFHAQAAGYEQPWSDVVSSGVITINRPFWRSAWFIAAAAGVVILIIFSLTSYISQKRYSRLLEEEVQKKVMEKQSIEQELQKTRKLEALGIMAGGIAHDFNNFLTAVLGNLSLLRMTPSLNPEHKEKLQSAINAAIRASSLTNQLLTFSRGGSPVREAGCMAELIIECASFYIQGTNIQIKYNLSDDLWPVEMDYTQMSQVINNILLNAKESMPDGGTIQIEGKNLARAPSQLGQGRYIKIEIKDEGEGIPKKDLDRVFDPYYSTKKRGHGLGLATSYSIVSKHDGLLTIDSEVGKGTTVSIYLPATDKKIVEPQTAEEPKASAGGKILVMDDNDDVRKTTKGLLQQLGYTVETSSEGGEAIRLYKESLRNESPFNAVVLDLTVPGGMGGRETLKHLLKIDPEVKAIVASGYSNDDVMANYSQYGFHASLNKPFVFEQLRDTLNSVLTPAGKL
jgi:signal transduction histidine kinase/ligand-binding sensor domain-containing protein/CheY-like chemotaxis protein